MEDKVKNWWNQNPYTYGLASKESYRDVGNVSEQELDQRFFSAYMRKVRKHFDDAQLPGEPIASRFIDYPWLKSKKALDIACGFGWSTVEMASAGAYVTAIDITSRAIEVTSKHLATRGLTGDLQIMDAQKTEFADNEFDFVLAWGCLMHMPNTEQAINEIYRVTKPGGRIAGYMYNKSSISYWWNIWFVRGILLGKLITYRNDLQRLVSRYTDGDSIGGNVLTKVYTPAEAGKMFETAGFKKVVFQPWGPPAMLKSFPFGKLPLGKLLSYRVRKAIADKYGWGMVFNAVK